MQAEQYDGDMLPSEPYNEKRMQELLGSDDIAEVHVFKATTRNLKIAELRVKYPHKNRSEIRKLLRTLSKS